MDFLQFSSFSAIYNKSSQLLILRLPFSDFSPKVSPPSSQHRYYKMDTAVEFHLKVLSQTTSWYSDYERNAGTLVFELQQFHSQIVPYKPRTHSWKIYPLKEVKGRTLACRHIYKASFFVFLVKSLKLNYFTPILFLVTNVSC
jgi:hypothetical protein